MRTPRAEGPARTPKRGGPIAAALLAAGLLVTLGSAAPALAQASDDIEITLEVVPSLQVTGERPLRFGRMVAGADKTVRPSSATAAGRWRIEGAPGESVVLSFELPTGLRATDGTEVPLRFGPQAAAWSAAPDGSTMTSFDPAEGLTVTLPASGAAYVSLGGAVKLKPHQRVGSYAATARLHAAYLEL